MRPVGLRGDCGGMQWGELWVAWLLKKAGEPVGREDCLEKGWLGTGALAAGAPLGKEPRGSLVGLRMKREDFS